MLPLINKENAKLNKITLFCQLEQQKSVLSSIGTLTGDGKVHWHYYGDNLTVYIKI
jgi:hypothetical protein